MISTTLEFQLTHNISAGEEVRFTKGSLGISIRRMHSNCELIQVVDLVQLEMMRAEQVDGYLGEILSQMAIELRGVISISK